MKRQKIFTWIIKKGVISNPQCDLTLSGCPSPSVHSDILGAESSDTAQPALSPHHLGKPIFIFQLWQELEVPVWSSLGQQFDFSCCQWVPRLGWCWCAGELGRRGRCLLQVSELPLGRAVLVAAVPVTSPEGLPSLYLNKMGGKFYLPYIYIT